jgi:16S rRNA (cytosine1402-N4)-methyltransferase
VPRAQGVYCDGTLGGAGHTLAVLSASAPDGRVIAIDRDGVALGRARQRALALPSGGDHLTLVHGSFGDVERILGEALAPLGRTTVDGFVLDLGLSSIQLDAPERGFSFSRPGPIDMRMDQSSGQTALDILRDTSLEELASLINELGEERFNRRIAAALKQAIRAGNLCTTDDLARVIDGAIPAKAKRHLRIHPATRTFQALRMAVNGELDQLARFLAVFPDLLSAGGRCVIISFHSLEDRMVKRRFRELAWSSSLPPDLARQAGERVDPICRILTRKPTLPGADEVARNPRSRSAKLRACERLAA